MRPGEQNDNGEPYEPEQEPDLNEWLWNRYRRDFGESDFLDASCGWLLTDGRAVRMGRGSRDEDHRSSVPTEDAMVRWGWPEEVIQKAREGTRSPAMRTLMYRSRAARIHAGSFHFVVHCLHALTARQKWAVMDYIKTYRPQEVVLEIAGRRPSEFRRPELFEVEEDLERTT